MHLENEYNEVLEENFFFSILFGRRFRPVLFRAILRMIFGVFFILMTLSDGGIYDGHFEAILSILYSLFLLRISVKEGIRWWRLREFEKFFFQEQSKLIATIQTSGFSLQLRKLFTAYQDINNRHLQTRNDYFYYRFFKFRTYIGTSVISQAFRLVPFSYIFMLILFNLYDSYFLLLFLIPLVILFFIIISKSSDYSRLYTKVLKERKTIIEQLNNYLSQ